ncbi:MAG TPA: DCC1-like thiol-disulfide oxidoreductase family protein [Opitutaceae bacterium]|nr:DCC1-like thiol-disulfide oxidoreductase family protein [Opitutaceae bacterium]
MTPPAGSGPLLFFDGECGLCQRLVRLLLRLDRKGSLRFAPLQGATAQAWLRAHALPTEDFSTLVFAPPGPAEAPRLRTDGIAGALRAAGRPGLARSLAIVPRPLRDAVYRLVARTRFALFGPWRGGRPLRPEWAGRFLP